MVNLVDMNPLYNQDFRHDPYPYFREGLQNKHIVRHEDFMTKPVSVFHHKDVETVFKDWETFSSEIGTVGNTSDMTLGKAIENIITMDPPRHTVLKKMARDGFLPRTLKTFEPQLEKIIKERMDFALETKEFDLVEDFAVKITLGMITIILGLPEEDWDMIRQWTIDIGENVLSVNWVTEPEQKRMDVTKRVIGEMTDYFEAYLADRRKNPKEGDIVSFLMSTEVDGVGYSDDEVESMVMLLLLAGNDSTATLIANYMRCMAMFPDQANLVRNDLSLVRNSVEETLRFCPSFLCMERMVKTPITMHGMDLQKGDIVLAWMAAANRDPEIFDRPDEFDISRMPNRHVSFAHGPHMCLGAPLARMESMLAATELLKNTKSLELISEPVLPGNTMLNGPLSQKIRVTPN